MRVQHVDGEYRVVLTPEAMAALHLSEGAEVEVRTVSNGSGPEPTAKHRYATVEEGLAAYRRTEHLHANTYRELAK